MTVGVPDVPATREWNPFGDRYLINEWRENGGPEQMVPSVVEGMQFLPKGAVLAGHKISPGVCNIFGYRAKYDGADTFDFIASKYYVFYAKLNLVPDSTAGYDYAYVEIEVVEQAIGLHLQPTPPSEHHIILGVVLTAAAPPYLSPGDIWWKDNMPALPESFEASRLSHTSEGYDIRTNLPVVVATVPNWLPDIYYKMNEDLDASLFNSVDRDVDPIDPSAGIKYVRPVKGRRGLGQLFDAYLGGVDSYRMATNPAEIKAEGNDPVDRPSFLFTISAYPFRDDVDMYLMYKEFDFYLKWDTVDKKLHFQVGDGASGWGSIVKSIVIPSFKDTWFHIAFGFEVDSNNIYIIVNNSSLEFQAAAAIGVDATDFYMGQTGQLGSEDPFYGILDEFLKKSLEAGYPRLFIEELYNFGVGTTWIGDGEAGFTSYAKASMFCTVGQVVGPAAEDKVEFDTPGALGVESCDVPNNKWIAPYDMIIQSYARILLEDSAPASTYELEIQLNGAVIAWGEFHSSVPGWLSLQISVTAAVSKDDFLEVFVKNNSVAPVTVLGGAPYSEFLIQEIKKI